MTENATEPTAPARRPRFSVRAHEVERLIQAHYERNEQRFEVLARDLATRLPDQSGQLLLRRIQSASGLQLLPPETRDLVLVAPEVHLADLILAPATIATIVDVCREYRARFHLRTRGLRPRSRLLFEGPPGNGKTSAAAALGAQVAVQTYVVSLPQLVESFLGNTSKNLQRAYAVLRAGHVLVLDELDCIGSARTITHDGSGKEYNIIVNTLLTLLDQINDDGVLVATTNRADLLDPALLRRFDVRLTLAAPTPLRAQALHDLLCVRYGVTVKPLPSPESFDAIAKHVLTEARYAALADWKEEDES